MTSRGERYGILLVAVALAMNGCGVTWGLPNRGDWAIDSIAPIGPLAYVHGIMTDGHWWSKYPPFHFGLLALLYAPYLALASARDAFHLGVTTYPYGFVDPDTALGSLTLIARWTSVVMATGAACLTYGIARDLYDRRAGLFAGLLFVSSPLTLYYADTANLDVPYVFWSSAALFAAVRIMRDGATWTYVAAASCAALAIATKDQAYGLFAALPVPFLVLAYRNPARIWPSRLVLAALVAVATYVVAANVLLDPAGWWAHVRYITHEGSAPYQMFPATLAGYAALAVRCVQLTADSMTWPALLAGIAGLAWTVHRGTSGASVLAWALGSYLVTFVGAVLYAYPRFMLPVVLVFAVFAGVACAHVWERGAPVVRAAIAAVVVYAFVYGTSMNLGLLLDSRYAAESWLTEHVAPGAVVGINGDATYLPRLPHGIATVAVDLSEGGPLAHGAPPDFLVLSDAYYRRYLRHANTRGVVRQLLAGGFGWERVAVFHRRGLAATQLIPTVNPRIVILRRRETSAAAWGIATSSCAASAQPPPADARVGWLTSSTAAKQGVCNTLPNIFVSARTHSTPVQTAPTTHER